MLVAVGLAVFALIGHAALWIGAINRIHATGASRRRIDFLTWSCRLVLIGLPLLAIGHWWFSGKPIDIWLSDAANDRALRLYLAPCIVVALITLWFWIERRLDAWRSGTLEKNHTEIVDVAARLGRKPV